MTFLDTIGGEGGCERLSAAFYRRVAAEPALARLFPGKTLRCATEEFSAFLIQFLEGDENRTQKRWWLSLRESHARFKVSEEEREAWLRQMAAALEEVVPDAGDRGEWLQFFEETSRHVIGADAGEVRSPELRGRWAWQLELDACARAIAEGKDERAVDLARRFVSRPSVYAGLLIRMLGRDSLVAHVIQEIEGDPSLILRRFNGRMLIHAASGTGRAEVVRVLLRRGGDPNAMDFGSHTPLYSASNEASGEGGPEVVRLLVAAGADVNASGGVMRATPLHMAARRGNFAVANALLESGADPAQPDAKGVTPAQRALNCRNPEVARLVLNWNAR